MISCSYPTFKFVCLKAWGKILFIFIIFFFKMPRERKLKVYDSKYKWGSINNGYKIKWYHVLIQLSKLFCLKAWGKFLFIFISFFSWQPPRIFLEYSIINLHVKIKIWQPYRKMQCLQLKSILFFQLALSNTWLVDKLSVNTSVVDSTYRKRQQKLRLL